MVAFQLTLACPLTPTTPKGRWKRAISIPQPIGIGGEGSRLTPPDMQVRIRRFVKPASVTLRWTFLCLVPVTARPSGKIPAASPPSPSLQVPYPGKSAFCAAVNAPLGPFSPSGDTAQISPGKNVDFPCTLAPFTASALGRIGLRC